jgi:hypothetical protein
VTHDGNPGLDQVAYDVRVALRALDLDGVRAGAAQSSAWTSPLRAARNGMSATTNFPPAPRTTARVCISMISGVAPSVSFSPWTTIIALSPTRRQSTGVSARRRALHASYAVTMAIFTPEALAAAKPSTFRIRDPGRDSGDLRAVTPPPQFPKDGKPADRRGWTRVLFAWR